jgi:hypothetical protein
MPNKTPIKNPHIEVKIRPSWRPYKDQLQAQLIERYKFAIVSFDEDGAVREPEVRTQLPPYLQGTATVEPGQEIPTNGQAFNAGATEVVARWIENLP